jgi:DEAD/DEAH box helicase domain-containing protein
MRDCDCAEGEQQKDGCYKCVLAYQQSRNLANISRREGLQRFGQVLEQWKHIAPCSTLSEVDASAAVESELEMKFLEALRSRVLADQGRWETSFHRGKECYEVVLGEHRWRVVPQVDMDAGPVRTRPDFGVYLLGREDVLPLAVYCDGLRYHVQPEAEVARIADDVHKRRALTRGEVATVWSVTWKDVTEFGSVSGKADVAPLCASALTEMQRSVEPLQLSLAARMLTQLGPMQQLYAFMGNPDEQLWRDAAIHALTSTLDTAPDAAALEDVWRAQRHEAPPTQLSWPSNAAASKLLAGVVQRSYVLADRAAALGRPPRGPAERRLRAGLARVLAGVEPAAIFRWARRGQRRIHRALRRPER